MILRGSSVLSQTRSSLGDFLVGPGFDLVLHHFAQNDSRANVNPPAQKAAIEAMPSVAIEEHLQCTVCLEDLEIGNQVKEMPCKHKFHEDCIVSWLKLHSSCPVCRFRMPSDDSIVETSFNRNEGNQYSHQGRDREERMNQATRNWLPLLSPFDNFPPSP
ncbi:hypothetical protein L6164_009162 [Bauhinia variegata]|nr:hypothetical protein L6164_009162 [Bauhinia variegata]